MAVIQGRLGELWIGSGAGTTTGVKAACELVSTKRYHVTDAAKRYLDPEFDILVYDNNVLVTSGYTIEGGCHIVFAATPTTPVTVTAKYLTPAEVIYVQNWTLDLQSDTYEITSLGDTSKKFMGSGLLSWSGSFERFYEDSTWEAKAISTSRLVGRFFTNQPGGLCWTGWIAPNSWTVNLPLELATENFGFTGVGKPVYSIDET